MVDSHNSLHVLQAVCSLVKGYFGSNKTNVITVTLYGSLTQEFVWLTHSFQSLEKGNSKVCE